MATGELPPPKLLRQLLQYDPDTGALLWKERPRSMFPDARSGNTWNAKYPGRPALNSERRRGYRGGTIFSGFVFAHRAAWAIHYGEWPQGEIDHVNGVTHDNRIANLRDVPKSINQRNVSRRRDNTSGVTGVHWSEAHQKWGASIMADNDRVRLGWFETREQAAEARKAANSTYGFTNRHGTSRA